MNDQAAWEQAVAGVKLSYRSLAPATAAELNRLIDDIMLLKQKLVELVTTAGSGDICRTCGGECCRYGKYHVSILDIMAHEMSAAELVTPDFSTNPACPYSYISGCTMIPGYRPMTCVVFNCQLVEDHLAPSQLETMRRYEQELRDAITRAGHITGMRLDRALLLSCS